jgi:hypothetical protein
MKQNNKPTTHGGNKKLIVLLTLLLAAGMTKVEAQEFIGKILFISGGVDTKGYRYFKYGLDINRDSVEDIYMRVYPNNLNVKERDTSVFGTLSRYLVEGNSVVFEGKDLHYFDMFEMERMYAIIRAEDKLRIDMNRLFPGDILKRDFTYYYSKYVLGQSR